MSSTPTPGAAPDLVKDATIETFQADVLQASTEVPVIVDFWATWCGPCKTLGPILEKAVAERAGQVKMVKVDVDKNQMLAQQLRIQSMPTVMGFIGGQPVDGFVGAVPESEVNLFIDRMIAAAGQMGLQGGASQAALSVKDLLATGQEALDANDLQGAIQAFADAAEGSERDSDEHIEALAGIARVQMLAGDAEAAKATLAQVPEDKADHPALAQINAQLSLVGDASGSGDLAGAEAAYRADPSNQEAGMSFAEALISGGRIDTAMDILLDLIAADREWNEGAARAKLLTTFEALGAAHPEVKKARRRLSSILFS